MRKVVARSNFSCNVIRNRPQYLTGHTATVICHIKELQHMRNILTLILIKITIAGYSQNNDDNEI